MAEKGGVLDSFAGQVRKTLGGQRLAETRHRSGIHTEHHNALEKGRNYQFPAVESDVDVDSWDIATCLL